jgi:bifunctional N-acetylglutamate synthase/kinase
MEPEVIQRFLESVGSKADVDLYLKLFRAQRKESFAIIAADAQIVRTALDPFHFDLRILAGLGLYPVVLLGLFDARDADRQAQRVHDWLDEDQVPARVIPAGADLPEPARDAVDAAIAASTIPLLSLEGAKEASTDDRFGLLGALAGRLETRKVVFLSASSGLEREGAPPISLVNLSVDYERLLVRGNLSRRHGTLLRQVKVLLDSMPQRMSVSVVNPLQLLRELFTINGAGTLIRKGSRIERHTGLAGVDRVRLRALIESAFGRNLVEGAVDPGGRLEQETERLYLEESYLGAALVAQSPVGPYLTKFAVERQAQGEGIGTDLWALLTRDYPAFFWRARPTNPITPWYVKQCDGLVRLPQWHVFWRGLPPEKIAAAIDYALAAAVDFVATSEVPAPPAGMAAAAADNLHVASK